jgi:hypothetical protein
MLLPSVTRFFLLLLTGCLLASSTSPPVRGQALPDSVVSPTLEEACRGGGSRLSVYLLQWSIRSRPLPAAARASLSPVARSAYRLFEQHYRPYADPQVPSTWALKYRVAVTQPELRVAVAPDSSFARWERGGYALDQNWNDPPVLRHRVIAPFRPRLRTDSLTVLFATPPDRRRLADFLLPPGVTDYAVIRRRIDCLDDAFGLTDWARTAEDVHSPPRLSVTVNERLTRAIAGYGWGMSGGVWVLYRRAAREDPWREVRPIGAWEY